MESKTGIRRITMKKKIAIIAQTIGENRIKLTCPSGHSRWPLVVIVHDIAEAFKTAEKYIGKDRYYIVY